jgi:uncharacterized protein
MRAMSEHGCEAPALSWDTAPFQQTTDLVGPLKLSLLAASTATDVDWIIKVR